MWFDYVYWLVIGVGVLLGLAAAAGVKGAFARWSQVRSRRGITGAQVAQTSLQANGIQDVTVERVHGRLTDHYDPRSKTLRLSEPVYDSDSVAALGVAAHEVGHAIQHAHGYAPLKFRSAWVPVAGFGTNIGIWLVIIAVMMGGIHGGGATVGWIGLLLFATSTVFTLITLPVEFDASKRALYTLQHAGILGAEEMGGARQVLNAAAMTYVAAFVTSLLQLAYWAYALGLFGRRSD
jgi:Zn-dependent membrane protease YugP